MAGLTSDNISIASARQYGFSKERNTCVFCGKKTTPPPSDPLAPVFAFFSLVDCRHYVCQPCALVNCDNAGRYIRCPTCHAVSRLAQSGKKRTGRDESRVAIDDGVSSVGSHASRRSMLIAANNRQLRSALARADRNKKRSNSVQFIATPKPTTASAAAENKSGNDDAAETTSPLTLDAVERLPKDPIFAQRELNRDSVTEHSGTEEPVRVNLYNIKSSSVPRRRPSGNRASSVPLPPTEHRYLVPPLPFAPPPPLRIHTIEEDENKDKKEGEEKVEEEKTNNNNNNSIKHNGDDEIGIDVSPRTIFAEIKETLRAYVVKEAQERTAIGLAEEHRRNAVIKQREIREKELLAVRGNLSSEFDIGLSPRTPLDASDEQVSATSDDDTPPNRPTANHYDAGSDDVLRHHEEEPPSAKVSISETATTSQEATTTTTTTTNATTTAGTKFENPKDNENSVPYEIMEAKEEENANVELEVQERGREHHETEETPLQQEQQEQQHGLEVMRIMERMVSELVENEIEEREMVEDLEDMERRRTHSMSEKNKMEISALEVQRLSAERTAQMVAEHQEYISKEIEELTSTENERRLFIEKLQRSEWSSVYSDFYTTLERIFEDEFIREEEQRKLELRRALSMLSFEESTARVQIEQTLLDDMTRLHMKCLETLADYRRQLEVDEMQLGLTRLLEERRFNVQQLHDLMVEENMTRWELIEGQRQDYHATWTSFITTMPAIRTTTAPPSSVASPTTFSIAHSSHVPETFAPASTSLTLASQYISAVLEEEELGSLHIQQTERHERHDLMKNFLAKCRRLKDAEAYAEDLYMETPISKRSIANGLRRLELQEEEMRIELQQRSWMLFRSILNKKVEEHQQIDEMERMLRSIAKRSRSVVKRCWGEVELALFEEETHERQKIEVGERRVYMNLSREATRRMEVLLAEERFSYDVSGVQFLEAMDAAVREFSSEAMRISQEEHLERLTMLQKERLDRLSVQQGVDESLLQRSNNDTRKQLEALRSTLEATTANNAWRARLSLVVTEEIRARDVVYNDEAGERSEWMGKERRERMEMASLETERILQEKEASRLREKMRECEEVEEQRRAGVQREETRAWNAFVKDEMQHASYAEKKKKERFRRTLDSCLQQEEDDRQDISDAERDAYRYLRRHAIQLSFDNAEKMRTSTAKTGNTSDKTGAVVVALPQSRGPSALSDLSAPIIDEEWIQQRRLKEFTREEELLETQMRLREAKLRIVEEEERCSRLEEEKRRTQAEADRLLFEAERRAEEHIRKAREEAEWYVENEVSRVRNVTEREAAHAAALRAIEEEEKRAVIEAKLLAAERALKEAEKRAEENMQSTKAEAETFAVAEARRVAIESKRQLQEYREEQELEMRRKDLEVKQRLHNIEQETREAISQEREKATRAAEEAKRRLEELEARYIERLAAVDAAKAGVREAQQQKQEFEGSLQATPQSHSRQQQQQQTEEQKEKHAVQDVETVATTNTTTAAVAAVLRGSREEAGNDDGCALPTSVWGSLIRSAIREAVEEIVRAKKEAWHLSEELEHRRRMERQHMRVRQVEHDRAEQDLIDVGSKSLMWSETGEDSRNLISIEENEVIEQHQQEQEQQQQVRNARKLPPPRRTMRHDHHHHHHHYHCVDEREVVGKYRLQRSSTNHGSCIYCGKNTVSPCGTCESQVCIYCGPGVRRSPCCNMHHINIINYHRRQLSREPHREEEEEEERRQQQEKDEYYEDVVGVERNIQDDSSIWDVEDSMAVTRPPEMEDSPSPPAVHHQLLPDEDSKVRNDSDGDDDDNNDEEPQRHERERQAMKEEERNKEEASRSKSRSEDHLNGSERSASNATVEEPMTEKKRYGVFFVPLASNAEPRRPKPPTPRNYVPGVFTATSKFAKVERRRTPSIRRAHTNKNYNHNTANRHVHPADKTVRHLSRSRFTESAPKRRPATSAHPKLHRDHVPRQSYDMPSSMRLREPAHGRYDSRPRRMDAERRVMHDPLSAFGTTLNPNYLGANVSAKTRSSPRRMMGRISPFRPSIEMDDDFNDGNDHYQDRDVSGLQRTYYNGKPLRPPERDYYHPDDMGNISSRPSRRHRHQEQYKPKANRSQQEEEQEKGHLNVTHEHVYVTTYQEMPHYEETQRRPESVVHNTRRLEECNLHTTPRLEELDQRLQRLKQHRLFDRVDRRSPDFHCLRHHCEQERESNYIHHHNSSNNNLAPASGRLRRPTPCSHDPCVTVRLFPNTHIPTQTNNTSRQKIRGDSSQRHMSRSGRRSTPRVISPPWRTDFNSEPLRPPWNVEQPHSFIAKPYKRSLLFVDP